MEKEIDDFIRKEIENTALSVCDGDTSTYDSFANPYLIAAVNATVSRNKEIDSGIELQRKLREANEKIISLKKDVKYSESQEDGWRQRARKSELTRDRLKLSLVVSWLAFTFVIVTTYWY